MQSWHIHISGRVQGVGFRPFVYRLAQSFHLEGTVQNGLDGVHIYVNAEADTVDDFCRQLKAEAPNIAQISSLRCEAVPFRDFSGCSIISSDANGQTKLLITPDLAMCDNCRQELHDPANRRFHYPFITCTQCGPRYSILKALPFDRENTSMHDFQMCSECASEYTDINHSPRSVPPLSVSEMGENKSPLPPLKKGENTPWSVPPLSVSEMGENKSPLPPLKKGENTPRSVPPLSVSEMGENKSPLPPLKKGENTPWSVPPQTGKEKPSPTENGNRYHAQTNSCHDCGIQLSLYDLTNDTSLSVSPQTESEIAEKKSLLPPLAKGEITPPRVPSPTGTQDIISAVTQLLLSGKIIAVKGIGGYLLMADATSTEVVDKLRQRKQRPAKPFALMYPSLQAAKMDVEISEPEENELTSYRAPILLLKLGETQSSGIALQQIAPGLSRLGVMLPYTPLFELIAQAVKRPLIATSANLSGSPIFYRDEEALENLQGIADFVLMNNREICLPQDDSVMQFTPKHQQAIILRRSRGLAPAYRLPENSFLAETSCLAMGAQQKSSFALSAHQQLYLSQYLGELSNYHSSEAYRHTLDYFLKLCQAAPEVIIADLHPDYFATQLGQQIVEDKKIPIRYVQHHQAHFAAVLTENELLESDEAILGVIWDGVGLGTDRQLWGGEFFTFADYQMHHVAQLKYFSQRFGDKMAREPRLSLLCLTEGRKDVDEILAEKFSQQEWKLYQKVLSRPALQQTSSMGRLFDAVASLLGLSEVNQYESQSAILLEQVAAAYLEKYPLRLEDGYHFQINSNEFTAPFSAMLHDLQKGKSRGELAARFHLGLVRLIGEVARTQQIQKIAFSGGVFQNALLTDLLITHLAGDFSLYFHWQLSPNDESLPLGQLACHWLSQQKETQKKDSSILQPLTLNI